MALEDVVPTVAQTKQGIFPAWRSLFDRSGKHLRTECKLVVHVNETEIVATLTRQSSRLFRRMSGPVSSYKLRGDPGIPCWLDQGFRHPLAGC